MNLPLRQRQELVLIQPSLPLLRSQALKLRLLDLLHLLNLNVNAIFLLEKLSSLEMAPTMVEDFGPVGTIRRAITSSGQTGPPPKVRSSFPLSGLLQNVQSALYFTFPTDETFMLHFRDQILSLGLHQQRGCANVHWRHAWTL